MTNFTEIIEETRHYSGKFTTCEYIEACLKFQYFPENQFFINQLHKYLDIQFQVKSDSLEPFLLLQYLQSINVDFGYQLKLRRQCCSWPNLTKSTSLVNKLRLFEIAEDYDYACDLSFNNYVTSTIS